MRDGRGERGLDFEFGHPYSGCFSLWRTCVFLYSVRHTAYCILYCTPMRKTEKNCFWKLKDRPEFQPTACPTACSVLWISHRRLFATHAHGHNKHNIYCYVAFFIRITLVWKDPGQALHRGQGSLLMAFSLIMDIWLQNAVFVVYVCVSVCAHVDVLPTGIFGSQQRSALVWVCCYRLQVKDQT